VTCAISTTSRCELSSSFFFFLQGKAPKEIHAILTETLGEHAPSYATVKNWVALFKCGDFSTCDAPRPGRPKTMTTLEIIEQIHELILEDRRISAKSIAEQLGVSREQVGSQNAWTRIKNDNGASRLSNFWNFLGAIEMISCRDWWPWTKPGYITVTRRQSNNQWSGGIAAHPTPKNSKCKNLLEKFSPQFFGIKTASSSLTIFQRAKLSMQSITYLCWCNWRILEGKMPGTCNPEETGLPGLTVSWSPTLFSRSGPVGLPPVPWTEKTIERLQFFVQHRGPCCRGDLVGRTTFRIFFWVACKS